MEELIIKKIQKIIKELEEDTVKLCIYDTGQHNQKVYRMLALDNIELSVKFLKLALEEGRR